MYGPGKSYNIFAGKDGSKGLGKSSLKPEDAVPDYSDLPETEMKVLNDWHTFFTYALSPSICVCGVDRMNQCRKRYSIVGKVTDLPAAVANL